MQTVIILCYPFTKSSILPNQLVYDNLKLMTFLALFPGLP